MRRTGEDRRTDPLFDFPDGVGCEIGDEEVALAVARILYARQELLIGDHDTIPGLRIHAIERASSAGEVGHDKIAIRLKI